MGQRWIQLAQAPHHCRYLARASSRQISSCIVASLARAYSSALVSRAAAQAQGRSSTGGPEFLVFLYFPCHLPSHNTPSLFTRVVRVSVRCVDGARVVRVCVRCV
jgi:hypothetical protein